MKDFKPIFHLHIPKNSGTSLLLYIEKMNGARRLISLYEDRINIDVLMEIFSGINPLEFHYTTHLPAQMIWDRIPPDLAKGFQWVSAVRSPIERELSRYRYLSKRGFWPPADGPAAGDGSLRTYLRHRLIRNPQCLFFHAAATAEAALEAVDRFGVEIADAKNISDLADRLFLERGAAPLPRIHVNATDPTATDEQLTPEVLSILQETLAEDQKLFEAIRTRTAATRTAPGGIQPLTIIKDLAGIRAVAGGGRLSFSIFGGGPLTPPLVKCLATAGLQPQAIVTSAEQGNLLGVPVIPLVNVDTRMRSDPILIVGEQYAPIYRLLREHGFQRIMDALDFATGAGSFMEGGGAGLPPLT